MLHGVLRRRALQRREGRRHDAIDVVGVHQRLQRGDRHHAAAALLAEDVGPVVAQEHAAGGDLQIPQRQPRTAEREVEACFTFTRHRLEPAPHHHLAVQFGGPVGHFGGHGHAEAGLGHDEEAGQEHQHHRAGQQQPSFGGFARQEIGPRRSHVEAPGAAAEGDRQRDAQACAAAGRTSLAEEGDLVVGDRHVAQPHRQPQRRRLAGQFLRHVVHRHHTAGVAPDAAAAFADRRRGRRVRRLGVDRHDQDDAGHLRRRAVAERRGDGRRAGVTGAVGRGQQVGRGSGGRGRLAVGVVDAERPGPGDGRLRCAFGRSLAGRLERRRPLERGERLGVPRDLAKLLERGVLGDRQPALHGRQLVDRFGHQEAQLVLQRRHLA